MSNLVKTGGCWSIASEVRMLTRVMKSVFPNIFIYEGIDTILGLLVIRDHSDREFGQLNYSLIFR